MRWFRKKRDPYAKDRELRLQLAERQLMEVDKLGKRAMIAEKSEFVAWQTPPPILRAAPEEPRSIIECMFAPSAEEFIEDRAHKPVELKLLKGGK